jgi:signal transduction histidine kinase
LSGSTELDALPCPVVVTDRHGVILFINQYALATFSISDQTRHLQIEQLFPPAANIFLQTHLWPLLRKNGAVSELYLKIKREPLAPLPVLLNVQEGTFEQQSCYRWVILPAEQRASFEQELIHARQQMQLLIKETEANKYMLQTVLDGAQDVAILAISKHGDICFANSGAELLFAQPVSDLANKSVLNFFSQDLASDQCIHTVLGTDGESLLDSLLPATFETQLLKDTGEYIDVQLQIRQLNSSLVLGNMQFILLISDISKRKNYEKLQNDFIATISHELRTPLTSILGSLHLLSSGKLGDIPEKAKKLIDITVNNANRLKSLVTEVLDFSKLKTNKLSVSMQSVILQPLLEEAIAENQLYLPDKRIALELSIPKQPIKVLVDELRFMQVISNLLSNAIKFSAPNTIVRVDVKHADKVVIISIEDQGPGIKTEFLPYLFTQFSQQDCATNRAFEGSGLGLAISKGLVESMRGNIGYRAGKNSGAVFWFSLLTESENAA